jgi:hypothetical protein
LLNIDPNQIKANLFDLLNKVNELEKPTRKIDTVEKEGMIINNILEENERFFLKAENVNKELGGTKLDMGSKDPRKRK